LPTVLMGATLPILVGYLDGLLRNVGASVGLLYAVNTLGSAAAALATVTLLFPWLGQADVARVAAGLNFVTAAAVAVWAYHWRGLSASREPRVEVVVTQAAVPSKVAAAGARTCFLFGDRHWVSCLIPGNCVVSAVG